MHKVYITLLGNNEEPKLKFCPNYFHLKLYGSMLNSARVCEVCTESSWQFFLGSEFCEI